MLIVLVFQNCDPYHDGVADLSSLGSYVVEVDPELHEYSMEILKVYCSGCHGGDSRGGVTGILNLNHLIDAGLITPGDSDAGRIVGSIEDASMPTYGVVPNKDLETIKLWISSMK